MTTKGTPGGEPVDVAERWLGIKDATNLARRSPDTIRHRLREQRHSAVPAGTVPLAEAQRRLGLSRQETLALTRGGLEVHRLPDYSFHVDEASLEAIQNKPRG